MNNVLSGCRRCHEFDRKEEKNFPAHGNFEAEDSFSFQTRDVKTLKSSYFSQTWVTLTLTCLELSGRDDKMVSNQRKCDLNVFIQEKYCSVFLIGNSKRLLHWLTWQILSLKECFSPSCLILYHSFKLKISFYWEMTELLLFWSNLLMM